MGSTSPPAHTMVATKVLISLCVVTLASAQNQQVIVNDVVTALQPSIARAVAEALRGLRGGSFNSGGSFSSGGSRFSSSSSSSGSSGSRVSGSSFGASGSAAGAEPTARPEYAYEFKVADEEEQTFISANEARDGDDVVGSYSYVDPNGDLITVNYQAGAMGYTQTTDKQVGAVAIRNTGSSSSSGGSFAGQSSSSSSRGSSSFGSSSRRGGSFRGSSSGLDQSALISQILAVLEPQIFSTVNNVVSQQTRRG